MAFRLFRFRHFSRQLLLLLVGLIALVQVSVYLLISRANRSNAIEHIDQNLRVGAKIFRQNLSERIDFLVGSAKVMSGDYAIKPLLMRDTLQPDTLRSTLLSYTERVKAPVITLFSPEGELLALTDEKLGTENVGPFRYLIRQAAESDKEQASGYSYLGGRLHVLVVVPLYAPYPNAVALVRPRLPDRHSFRQRHQEHHAARRLLHLESRRAKPPGAFHHSAPGHGGRRRPAHGRRP